MRLLKPALLALFMLCPWLLDAQVPVPQLNLSGNIGCIGFPCVNTGTFSITSDADTTLPITSTATSAFYLKVTSTVSLTATRKLNYPAGQFPVGIENATTGGQALSVCGPSGTCVSVPNSSTSYTGVWNDGTNFVQGFPANAVLGSGTTGDIPLWSGTGTLGNSPLSVSSGAIFDTGTFHGQDVCWHYEAGNTPQEACLRYAGHGNYYGPYNTNDGTTFTPTPFSVGQLNIGQAGATGVNGQAQAPSILFYENDTDATGPVAPVMATIAMYQAQPTGACPNAGVSGAVPVWGFAPDHTISFCTNAAASTWALFSSGGTGALFPSTNGLVFNTSTLASTTATSNQIQSAIGTMYPGRVPVSITGGAQFWGNSECADVGANPTSLGWASRFVSTYMVGTVNGVTTRRCLTGSFSADVINFGALLRQTTQVSLVPFNMPSYGAPLTFVQSLENDANNNTGLNAALQMAAKEQDFALIALGTAPLDQQIQATNTGWTCSGAQGGDDYYASILPGTILTAGQTCSTSIITVAAPNSTVSEPIDMLYTIFASDTGSGTVTIDGALATDTITGASTLANAPYGGAALLTASSFTRTLALARFIPATVGTHTVSVAGVATGTNGFGLQSIFTTPVGIPSYAAPTVIKTGVLRQRLDAAATATAAYDAMSIADCNQMWADGFRCIPAPSRAPFITPANLSFMMANANTFTAGAVQRTNLTFTASSTTITSATNFDSSYVQKQLICTDGLTSSTDYSGVVTGWTTASPANIIVSPAIGNSSGAGTGVCYFGTNSQITLASASPGLHPANSGHDAELQGVMSVVQPAQLPPVPPGFTNFALGMATNLGQSGGMFQMNYANNTPLTTITSVPYCATLFGINPTSTIAGTCFSRDTVKSAFFTGLVAQNASQIKFGDQNVSTYQNGSFRWNFAMDSAANSGAGLFFNNGLDSWTTTTFGSNSVIFPLSKFVEVTGTAAISTITIPNGSASLGSAAGSPAAVSWEGCINFIASGGTPGANAWSVTAGSTILTGFTAIFGQQYTGCYDGTNWRFSGPGIGSASGLSGMTASQVPIAATATTVTSSEAIAGSGAGLTSGPTSATATDLPVFTSTTGGLVDSGVAIATLAPLASPALTGTPTAPTATVGTNTTQVATTAFVLANAGGGSGTVTYSTPTTTGCITNGSVTWTEASSTYWKQVTMIPNDCVGDVDITFPVAFTNIPSLVNPSSVNTGQCGLAGFATTATTTAVSIAFDVGTAGCTPITGPGGIFLLVGW